MSSLPTPRRIAIPSELIVSGQSISIPLHVIQVSAAGEHKVGILVQATGANGVSAVPQLYEFDTGGQGFWMHPTGSLPVPPLSQCTLSITYTSGITYLAAPTPLTLTFPEASAPLSADVTVGLIGQIQGKTFPIFGHFWGDFGAALQCFHDAGGAAVAAPALLTALAQLPAPYRTGFIVDVGPYPGGGNAAVGANAAAKPQVIVGLTDELRALFPNTVPMTPSSPYTSPQTQQTIPAFAEDILDGNLQLGANVAPGIGVVFDTGAPTTEVHFGTEVKPAEFTPTPGELLQLTPSQPTTADADPFALLSYQVGTQSGLDQAQGNPKDVLGLTAGYINTGLNPFFQSPILFDLERAVVGFPSTQA